MLAAATASTMLVRSFAIPREKGPSAMPSRLSASVLCLTASRSGRGTPNFTTKRHRTDSHYDHLSVHMCTVAGDTSVSQRAFVRRAGPVGRSSAGAAARCLLLRCALVARSGETNLVSRSP